MKKNSFLYLVLFLLTLLFTGMGFSDRTSPADPRVVIGAEQLLTAEYLPLIRGKRVGLVTNHTGLLPDGRHLVDVLFKHPEVKLAVLFGPEHGIRGDADEHVANGIDKATGLPVISLYGKVRKPTAEMLKDVDVLIFDIQDIGARFYTYIATMNHVLGAAADRGIPYIVLDRPNAIGSIYVDGPLDSAGIVPVTGVGQLPVAHGMTVGELAMMFNGERRQKQLPQAKLTVIPMKHYKRSQWYDETGLPWIKPSPNMLTLTTAAAYPATCLLEGTNVSEARGTLHPFEHIAAPWIDGDALSKQLNGYKLPGVMFRPATVQPDSVVDGIRIYPPKFVGQSCKSANLVITDRNRFQSARAGVYILHALLTLYPDKVELRDKRLDNLLGTSSVREQLVAGKSPQEIVNGWDNGLKRFKKVRSKYLIYQ